MSNAMVRMCAHTSHGILLQSAIFDDSAAAVDDHAILRVGAHDTIAHLQLRARLARAHLARLNHHPIAAVLFNAALLRHYPPARDVQSAIALVRARCGDPTVFECALPPAAVLHDRRVPTTSEDASAQLASRRVTHLYGHVPELREGGVMHHEMRMVAHNTAGVGAVWHCATVQMQQGACILDA